MDTTESETISQLTQKKTPNYFLSMTSGILCHIIRNNFVMIAVSSHTNCKGMPQAAKFSSNVHCLQHSRSMCIGWSKYSTWLVGSSTNFQSARVQQSLSRGRHAAPVTNRLTPCCQTTSKPTTIRTAWSTTSSSFTLKYLGELRNQYIDIYISLKQQLNRVDYREDDFFFVSVTRNGTLLGYSVDIISLIRNL